MIALVQKKKNCQKQQEKQPSMTTEMLWYKGAKSNHKKPHMKTVKKNKGYRLGIRQHRSVNRSSFELPSWRYRSD
jgi:hypothetical protein